jgi:hypothetical protein
MRFCRASVESPTGAFILFLGLAGLLTMKIPE